VKNIDSDTLIHDIILDQKLFPVDLSLAAYDFSISTLKKREQFTDVVISDFIEKNYTLKKIFYQFNHPTNDVFQHIVNQIMNILEKDIVVNPIDEILTDISIPIYPSTYRNLNLQFKNNYKYSTILGFLDLNSVVEEFYKYYEKFDREILEQQILKKKPFLWERIIDKW